MAAISMTFVDIDANLHAGGRADALKAALGANLTNGLRRTNADKRRVIEIALKEFPKLSDRAIAEMCGVSHDTVATCRPQDTNWRNPPVDDDDEEPRTGLDGRKRRRPKRKPAPELEGELESEPVVPRKAGPPSIGMQFARIAIMKLQQIRKDDLERAQAFATVREWINEHE